MSRRSDVLAWLNGRMVAPVYVVHNGKRHTVWTPTRAQEEGLTIEDAVAEFCDAHGIDLTYEAANGASKPARAPKRGTKKAADRMFDVTVAVYDHDGAWVEHSHLTLAPSAQEARKRAVARSKMIYAAPKAKALACRECMEA